MAVTTLDTSSYSLALSPKGFLYSSVDTPSTEFLDLHKKLSKDWREGWFHLGADKTEYDNHPSIRFWQDIAKEYITALCHLPEEVEFSPVEFPGPDLLSEWIFKIPPMTGGEYLSLERVKEMWDQLNSWVASSSNECGGVHGFLQKKAPKWQQVGKVCFHLAENKKNPDRPFAFLATYSTGFTSKGKTKHLPLKRALEQSCAENNHQSLVKLLTPVQKAADQCSWVKYLVETNEL